MTGALRIHALVRRARVLVFIGAMAENLSLLCRRRAGRITRPWLGMMPGSGAAGRRQMRRRLRLPTK
jgi:hypothetical protein